MGWQVIVTPSARADLAEFPELGRMVPEFQKPNLREIICRSYRVIYRLQPENKRIQIIRFWHGARGFPHVPGNP